jgi:hypothetical protein
MEALQRRLAPGPTPKLKHVELGNLCCGDLTALAEAVVMVAFRPR